MQNLSLNEAAGASAMDGAALLVSAGESDVPSRDSNEACAASRGGGGGGGGVGAAVRFARRASRGSVDMTRLRMAQLLAGGPRGTISCSLALRVTHVRVDGPDDRC